jgi:hypothetical protein
MRKKIPGKKNAKAYKWILEKETRTERILNIVFPTLARR